MNKKLLLIGIGLLVIVGCTFKKGEKKAIIESYKLIVEDNNSKVIVPEKIIDENIENVYFSYMKNHEETYLLVEQDKKPVDEAKSIGGEDVIYRYSGRSSHPCPSMCMVDLTIIGRKDDYNATKVSLSNIEKVYEIKRENLHFPPYKCFVYHSKEKQTEIGTINGSIIEFKIEKSLLGVGDIILVTNNQNIKSKTNPFGKFVVEEILIIE